MNLIILTKSPIWQIRLRENLKAFLKFILKRGRGPKAVNDSLLRGLKELNVDYKYNPKESEIKSDDVVWVNESKQALIWAIKAKKNKTIKSLYVGPNIFLTPTGEGNILLSPMIDKILFPSQWTKDFFCSFDNSFQDKIEICPAGVEISNNDKKQIKFDALIFVKHKKEKDLLDKIKAILEKRNLNYREIFYGSFDKEKYFGLLKECRFMIYLSYSESQGIALQEAWVRDIPTLVWNRGYAKFDKYKWRDKKISAPYLIEQCGYFFATKDNFLDKLNNFTANLELFTPKKYVKYNLTDEVCTKKILEIMNIKYE